MNGKSGKVVLGALVLALMAGGAYLAYTVRDWDEFLADIMSKNPFSKTPPPETEAVSKHDKRGEGGVKDSGHGGRSVKDVLGGPEFSGGKASIPQAAPHTGVAEQPAKAPSAARTQKTEAAPPPIAALPPPPPVKKPLPPFPKTKGPTLNFTVETPQTKQPQQAALPPKQPPQVKQPLPPLLPPAKQPLPPLLPSAQPEASKKVQAAAAPQPPPPPPPPPPKPRATMVLSSVSGRLSDRADITVTMSVEMIYEANSALREEMEFKRDLLTTVASAVLRKHEAGAVNTAVLKTDLLATFNGQLQAGKLIEVDVKDLQIGQAVAGN